MVVREGKTCQTIPLQRKQIKQMKQINIYFTLNNRFFSLPPFFFFFLPFLHYILHHFAVYCVNPPCKKSCSHAVKFMLITSLSPCPVHPVETNSRLASSSQPSACQSFWFKLIAPPLCDHDSPTVPHPLGAFRADPSLPLRQFVYQFPHHDIQTTPPPPAPPYRPTFMCLGGEATAGAAWLLQGLRRC